MFCIYCGAPNPDVASFCGQCGKAIVRPPANAQASAAVAPPAAVAPAIPQGAAAAVVAAQDASASVASGGNPRTLAGHSLPIYSLAFSPDGRWLASGSLDKTAKLWDVASGHELRTFTGNLRIVCVQFSPDGRRLVLAATNGAPLDDAKPLANSITLWDSTAPNEVRNFSGHEGQLFCVRFSPDGRLLASTKGGTAINLWDVTSGQIIKTFKQSFFRAKLLDGAFRFSLAFSPDGRLLAGRSNPLTLWDLANGKEARTFGTEAVSLDSSVFLDFTPDGQSIVEVKGGGAIRIWDVMSGREARCLADPPKKSGVTFAVLSTALSANGRLLAISSYCSGEEPRDKVTLWDVAAGRILGIVTGINSCQALAFSPDGQWLAVGDMIYGGATPVGAIKLLRTSEIR